MNISYVCTYVCLLLTISNYLYVSAFKPLIASKSVTAADQLTAFNCLHNLSDLINERYTDIHIEGCQSHRESEAAKKIIIFVIYIKEKMIFMNMLMTKPIYTSMYIQLCMYVTPIAHIAQNIILYLM